MASSSDRKAALLRQLSSEFKRVQREYETLDKKVDEAKTTYDDKVVEYESLTQKEQDLEVEIDAVQAQLDQLDLQKDDYRSYSVTLTTGTATADDGCLMKMHVYIIGIDPASSAALVIPGTPVIFNETANLLNTGSTQTVAFVGQRIVRVIGIAVIITSQVASSIGIASVDDANPKKSWSGKVELRASKVDITHEPTGGYAPIITIPVSKASYHSEVTDGRQHGTAFPAIPGATESHPMDDFAFTPEQIYNLSHWSLGIFEGFAAYSE